MKVKKLLRNNTNAVITIILWDGAECYTLPSKSPALEKYMNRKVWGWYIGATDACNPVIVITLEKEADNEG